MIFNYAFLFQSIFAGLISDSLYCYDPVHGNSFRSDLENEEIVGGIVGGTTAKINTWKWIVRIDLGHGFRTFFFSGPILVYYRELVPTIDSGPRPKYMNFQLYPGFEICVPEIYTRKASGPEPSVKGTTKN